MTDCISEKTNKTVRERVVVELPMLSSSCGGHNTYQTAHSWWPKYIEQILIAWNKPKRNPNPNPNPNPSFILGPLSLLHSTHFEHHTKLTLIHGPVGSGKTTLLLGILGQLYVSNTTERDVNNINMKHYDHRCTAGYLPQMPTLHSGSVRSNILFGKAYKADFYKKVIGIFTWCLITLFGVVLQ
jgi:hypothetical protein